MSNINSTVDASHLKMCVKGLHTFSGHQCKECKKAYLVANADKIKAQDAQYRIDNKEKRRDARKLYRTKNAALVKARAEAYRKENSAAIKAAGVTYRIENKAKISERQATYYAKNTERIRERNNLNPSAITAKNAAYYLANSEKIKLANSVWSKNNPDSARVRTQNRRARKKESGGILSSGLAAKLFKLQKGKCPCCKQPLGDNYHLDHKMPLALGGTNTDENMQLLRQRCNTQKKAKHPVDFMQSRGFLL